MKFLTSTLDVEVSYKKAGNEIQIREPKVDIRVKGKPIKKVRVVKSKKFLWQGKELRVETKLFDPETEKEVDSSEAMESLEHYGYKYLDELSNEIKFEDYDSELDIEHLAHMPDGTVKPCIPFPRTSVLDLEDEEKWVPSTAIEGWLIESVYEIFSDDKATQRKLFAEADKRLKKDQIGVTSFSWGGGFKQYYCFLCPELSDGKFSWLMKLSTCKLAYNHQTDIPAEVKIPVKPARTLPTLPPVKALIVATRKKKTK